MLTRSFIQSFLLVKNDRNLDIQKNGLEVIKIKNVLRPIEPTETRKGQKFKITIYSWFRGRKIGGWSF